MSLRKCVGIVDAEYRVDTFHSKQFPELRHGGRRFHRSGHRIPCVGIKLLLLDLHSAAFVISFQGLIPHVLPDTAGFDRRPDPLSVVCQRPVHDARIIPPLDRAAAFLDGDIKHLQQGSQFPERNASVAVQARAYPGGKLLFHVAGFIIYPSQFRSVSFFFSQHRRPKIVFRLYSPQGVHRAACLEVMRKFPSLAVDTERHDMQVVAVDVGVFEDEIRLFPIPLFSM